MFYFLVLSSVAISLGIGSAEEVSWARKNELELEEALKIQLNTGVAKNVVLFIGDGMGPNTVTAARIYDRGEKGTLCFEKFPHLGMLKTYSANMQVPESASTATALMCGEKVNFETLGVTAQVKQFDCDASLKPENRLKSIADWGQKAGKSTGLITTTRVTHATPAAMYAHSASREWECDQAIPKNASDCKDIARQLIEDEPGRNLNVIMGGGLQMLVTNSLSTPETETVNSNCRHFRFDGRNLVREWQYEKKKRNSTYQYVTNTEELLNVNSSETEYLLGIFTKSYMPFESNRNKGPKGTPSLQQMTEVAIKTLVKNDKGFILMVEGGLIDVAHHRAQARKSLEEVIEFNKAINATVRLLEQLKVLEETLIIVTSDHSHTLTINGYPKLGNDILGIAQDSLKDGIPYTTLQYGVVGPKAYHYNVSEDGKVIREDPSKVNTSSYDYRFQGSILSEQNTHGGSDVLVYARGPMAHLIHGVHEQNYITKVITYAAAIGPDSNRSRSAGVRLHPAFYEFSIAALVLTLFKSL